jgi:Domain of Unknown Function with PDB structure (DUF3857)
MRFARCCLFLFCLGFVLPAVAQKVSQKHDWLPITQEDLAVKEVPGDAGAPAIQLYYANFIDDTQQNEFVYQRIKILNEKGKKWADVEIPTANFLYIRDLKARTIRPDGSIVEFTGKPFEKTILKGRGIKFLVKSFTLPEAAVGSIVEYKYTVHYEDTLTSDNWILQHDLFTVKEEFYFKPYGGQLAGDDFEMGSRIAWVSLHIGKGQEPKMVRDSGEAELQIQNMAAFQAEEYMPPENNYKPSVSFFYVAPDTKNVDKYWENVGKKSYGTIEHFIGDHKEVREASLNAIGSETDPEKKLRKLYARAQEIRNLSYERERSAEERKKEQIKENGGIAEVVKRGYGDRWDIVRLFVGMARAAGFDASILRVSKRKDQFFVKEVLSSRQLNSEIAVVKLNGKDVYLDPGTKYCPYGLLHWERTSTAALRPDKKSPTFVMVPAAQQDKAVTRRTVKAALTEDGLLKGDVEIKFQGMEALERRLNAMDLDEAGKKKDLEDELKTLLPAGAVVNLKDVKGWQETDEPLVANFNIEIPAYASVAGKRLLVPTYLFQVKQKDAFSHAERQYPVYFPYAFAESDVIILKFPAGFSPEGTPQNQDVSAPYARYQNVGQFESGQLVTKRVLLFNGIFFPMNQYSELKNFFSKVQAGDEQQAVLRVGGSTSAQKGN